MTRTAPRLPPSEETVPRWKKEVYEGGEEWVGRGSRASTSESGLALMMRYCKT